MADYLTELYKRRRQQEGLSIGEGLRSIGATLMGQQYTPQKRDETIEDFVLKEQLKRQIEQEDPFYKAKVAAISGTGTMGGGAGQQDILSGIPQEERQYWVPEPITKTVEGVPVITGYKATKSPAGEQFYSKKEEEQKAVARRLEAKEKGMPAETAGKFVMAQQAVKDIDEAKSMLFPKGTVESFSRGRAFLSNIPGSRLPLIGGMIPQAMPFSATGQKIYSKLQNAVAAKLRIETGAQANPSEVENILARFGVTSFSSPEAAWDALDRLRSFMTETVTVIDPAGNYQYAPKTAVQATGSSPTEQSGEITEEDIAYTMKKHNLSREEVLKRIMEK